jgi:hypothetical protein
MTTTPDGTLMASLRTDLAAAELEWDRVDSNGDIAATARVWTVIEPRIRQLRRAIAAAERDQPRTGA